MDGSGSGEAGDDFTHSFCFAVACNVPATQAMLLISDCIKAKGIFALLNRALLARVPSSAPTSIPPGKIIVMKLRSGQHNVTDCLAIVPPFFHLIRVSRRCA